MPQYVDVAIERWQAFTGETAKLEDGGRTFAEVTGERKATNGPARAWALSNQTAAPRFEMQPFNRRPRALREPKRSTRPRFGERALRWAPRAQARPCPAQPPAYLVSGSSGLDWKLHRGREITWPERNVAVVRL